MRLLEAKEEKEAALSEHTLIKKFFNEISALSDARQEQIVDLKQQLTAKEKQRVKENEDWKFKYEMDIDVVETKYQNELKLCKELFMAEV